MNVSEKEVAYVAELANLDLTPEERTRMVRDLNSILGYIDMLNELDTTNVAPMTQVMAVPEVQVSPPKQEDSSGKFAYAQRDDRPAESLPHQQALENSPAKHPDFFKVPRVIER